VIDEGLLSERGEETARVRAIVTYRDLEAPK
jgi:hypothetical protein